MKKDGDQYLLMANSSRGVMKIPTDGIAAQEHIDEPVRGGGRAGIEYATIEDLQGVVQLDKLNDSTAVVLVKADAGMNLSSVALP